MNRTPPFLLALALVGACSSSSSSIDQDVIPVVVQAELSVDPGAPSELAASDIVITFATEGGADRDVVLHQVALVPEAGEPTPLMFAFPSDFDGRVRQGEEPTLSLVNEATTNSDLSALCGREDLLLLVHLQYAGTGTFAFNDATSIALDCP